MCGRGETPQSSPAAAIHHSEFYGPPCGIGNCALLAGIHDGAVIFQHLRLWVDEVARSGPETMAVDEWLLETIDYPVLRVYSWDGDWGSLGYFGAIAEARESFPGLKFVRRWTGGGIVDHREDWTYTLVVPKSEPLAKLRGAKSYLDIHEKLLETIESKHVKIRISDGKNATKANVCFENPVTFDLVTAAGQKLAGAGQRRSRSGLLHQGSVADACADPVESRTRAEQFAANLAGAWSSFHERPEAMDLRLKISARYERFEWLNRC